MVAFSLMMVRFDTLEEGSAFGSMRYFTLSLFEGRV